MNLRRLTDATSEPFALNEVKNQLRITSTADDNSFRQFIAAVRKRTEHYLEKTLITTEWEAKFDAFESVLYLPMGPIQSISSVAYVDTDGNPQTFTDYQFDRWGRLSPANGFDWPATQEQFDAVTVTYIAGETDAGEVDEDIKQAMLLWIGALDVGRENTVIGAGVVVSEVPAGAESLLHPHKKWWV